MLLEIIGGSWISKVSGISLGQFGVSPEVLPLPFCLALLKPHPNCTLGWYVKIEAPKMAQA